ncbi:MAG: glycosyltransferase family 39 protein, partial [Anaerolineales bacterium]
MKTNSSSFLETLIRGNSSKQWFSLLAAAVSLLSVALLLTWFSNQFQGLDGWLSFLMVLILAALVVLSSWILIKRDRQITLPRFLFWLLLSAVLIRLLLGAFWVAALPAWGHDTPVQQAGYVMEDAHSRDTVAWELARSDSSLWTAFRDYAGVDQYGGLLYLSALIYRYLGGEVHQPLLVIIVTASFSSIAIVFIWAFIKRSLNESIAWLAAILLAIYPEAVLLGSSQMREAFTITLVSAAFYGLGRYWQERSVVSMAWILAALALTLPFSPAFTVVLLALLAVQGLALGQWRISHDKRFWMILAAIVTLAVGSVWVSWRQIAPEGMSNPLAVLGWWITKSAEWQFHLTERSSGWVQRILAETPDWMNIPMLVIYGVVRPFLPAALIAGSDAPIWTAIAIWRSIGWTILLPFLIYAPFKAFNQREGRGLFLGLSLVVWIGILIASFRGGGDMWDNPRYRAAFASLQVILVAWLWV